MNTIKLQYSIELIHQLGLRLTDRSNTSYVEGSQGQLGSRFSNGLRRNNTHCITYFSDPAGSQVFTIAFGTNTTLSFTCQHRSQGTFSFSATSICRAISSFI